MFRAASLKLKLLLLCFALSIVTAAVGVAGYISLKRVSAKYHHIAGNNLPNIKSAGEMFVTYRRVRISLRTLGLPSLSEEDANSAIKDVQQEIDHYETAAKAYLSSEYEPGVPFGPGEKELYDDVEEKWKQFKEVGSRVISLYRSGTPEDRQKMLSIFFHECPKSAKVYTESMLKLIDYNDQESKKWVAEAQDITNKSNGLVILMVIGGVVGAMAAGTFFAVGISSAISSVSARLSEGADQVTLAVNQIASASQQIATGATEQAAALQETTASVEETSAMIAKNAENAKNSAEVSLSSQSAAENGKKAVEEMVQSIQEISNSNDEIMRQIEESNRENSEIVKLISDIGNKTKVINDIVFQTKLLSFNASVEAARAGEHGKGFAVVAEEVGNLAQMSGNSAKEISQMLEESIQKVDQIANNTKSRVERLMLAGKEKVQVGIETAKRCGEVLDGVVRNVGAVGEMVAEISTASQEQARGVQEISSAMNQLDQAGQLNNSASQQATHTAEALRRQVDDLRAMVSALNETIFGAHGGQVRVDPAPASVIQPAAPGGNIIAFRKEKDLSSKEGQGLSMPVKKAVGGENLPSAKDERFRDV